jgi:hypothetical protein
LAFTGRLSKSGNNDIVDSDVEVVALMWSRPSRAPALKSMSLSAGGCKTRDHINFDPNQINLAPSQTILLSARSILISV